MEAIREPASVEFGRGVAVGGVQRHRLFFEVRSLAQYRPFGASDVRPVLRSEFGVGVEGERRLRAVEFHECLSQQRRVRDLARRRLVGCVHPLGFAGADETAEDVEPVDREVVEDRVLDVVDLRFGDPVVVPVDGELNAVGLTDEPAVDRLAHVTPVGCPATVLVDREFDAALVGELDHALAEREVDGEGFLAQNVLSGVERVLDEGFALDRMRQEVDDLHVVASEHVVVIGVDVDVRVGIELVPAFDGVLARPAAHRDHVVARRRVGLTVLFADPAHPDHRDPGVVRLRVVRLVWQVGRFDRFEVDDLREAVVVLVVGHAHSPSETVSPRSALCLAASTMRWASRQSSGLSGPNSTAWSPSIQSTTYWIGFWSGASSSSTSSS